MLDNSYTALHSSDKLDPHSRELKMIDPQNMSILIADDMETMCTLIRSMLKDLGYGKRFHFAPNGLLALNVLKKNLIDLAIVDWNMPIMNGMELLASIREDSALREIPVIMITGEANKEIVAEAAEADINAFILKPLTAKSLESKISSIIESVNNPPPMVLHLNKARKHEEDGNIDLAIKEAKLAMKTDLLSSKPVRELGYFYFKKNDLDTAERWLIKAAAMNELDVFSLHYLGEIYVKRNDIEKASIFFDKAMKISPRHISRGINFGKILIQKDMIDKGLKVFDKAIRISKDPLSTREEIAEFCIQNEMHEYAIRVMDFILKKMPTRYDIMFKLGIANENIGRPQKALSYLIKAGKINKDNIEIKMHIAKNYLEIGQRGRATEVLKSVLEIDPENQKAKDLLRF